MTNDDRFRRTSAVLVPLSLLGAALAQYFISAGRNVTEATCFLIASVACCGAMLAAGGGSGPERGARLTPDEGRGRGWPARIAWWLVAAAGLAGLILTSRLMFTRWDDYYYKSLLFYGAGLVLLSAGLNRAGRRVFRSAGRIGAGHKLEICLFLTVLAVGIYMRAWRLDYFPPPDGIAACEEAQQGTRAYRLAYEGHHLWEFYLSNLVSALSFKTLGVSMVKLRIPAVALASLTLIPFYLMIRLLMGYRVALAATFLFAVSRWHLCYARVSHNVFIPLFFVMLVLYLLVRMRHAGRPSTAVWIGAFSGFLLFSYAGYRSTILIALYYMLEKLIRGGSPPGGEGSPSRGRWAAGVAIVLAVAAAVSIPMFKQAGTTEHYFEAAVRTTRPFQNYYDEKSVGDYLANRWERIASTARLFTYRGDSAPTLNIPDEPMLDPATGLLFFIGLAYCFAALRRDDHLFFSVLLVLVVYMGAILVHNFDVRRLISLIPLIYVFVAFALSALWGFAERRGGRWGRGAALAGTVVVCAFALFHNHSVYFGRQISEPRIRTAYKNFYTILVDYVKELPEGTYVISVSPEVPNLFGPMDLEWLLGNGVRGKCVTKYEEIFPLPNEARTVVIFESPPDVKGLAGRLKEARPDAVCEYRRDLDRPDLEIMACTLGPPPPEAPVLRKEGGEGMPAGVIGNAPGPEEPVLREQGAATGVFGDGAGPGASVPREKGNGEAASGGVLLPTDASIPETAVPNGRAAAHGTAGENGDAPGPEEPVLREQGAATGVIGGGTEPAAAIPREEGEGENALGGDISPGDDSIPETAVPRVRAAAHGAAGENGDAPGPEQPVLREQGASRKAGVFGEDISPRAREAPIER